MAALSSPSSALPLRCVVVDSSAAVADAVVELLQGSGHKVNGVARTGAGALSLIEEVQPDVLVVDVRALRGDDGIDVVHRAREVRPNLVCIVHTTDAPTALVSAALETGAKGVVLKHGAPGKLIDAVDAAIAGRIYLDPDLPVFTAGG